MVDPVRSTSYLDYEWCLSVREILFDVPSVVTSIIFIPFLLSVFDERAEESFIMLRVCSRFIIRFFRVNKE